MNTLIMTILLAMAPISELRGAIPYGLHQGLPWYIVFIIAIIGNLIPVIILLKILPYFFKTCLISSYLWGYTRKRHNSKFTRWGEYALVVLVAIPLPFTGAWTGALTAIVFGIPFNKAIKLIFIGVLIAGIIVTLATLGILWFL